MKIPSIFKIRREQNGYNQFPLDHTHISTTDFYRLQPILSRELVPHDKGSVNVESFVRLFPMPFPTFGRIKYYNRAFFVPYRTIMRGFNEFLERVPYTAANGQSYTITSVPVISNSVLAGSFNDDLLSVTLDDDAYITRIEFDGVPYDVLTDAAGRPYRFDLVGSASLFLVYQYNDSYFNQVKPSWYLVGSSYRLGQYLETLDPIISYYTSSTVSPNRLYELTLYGHDAPSFVLRNISDWGTHGYLFVYDDSSTGHLGEELFVSSFVNASDIKFDFINSGGFVRRFTNFGRYFYQLLTSLGYRVDFSHSNGDFTNTEQYSAGKLLAYMKVWLDYYAPSNFDWSQYYKIFQKEAAHIELFWSDISDIVKMFFVGYERDYFTSAWQHANGPNGSTSSNQIPDINYVGTSIGNRIESGSSPLALDDAPNIQGYNVNTGQNRQNPTPITQYMIDALSSLQQYVHRHQLAGYRVLDRYFARFGIKLSDDRTNRAYYLGGYSYDAMISDVMSSAETAEGQLGDFAGKGSAYSDRQHSFNYDVEEYGFLIIMSSVVPQTGYVQGIMRENFHVAPLDFHTGSFDNLGTQPIRRDELFADNGMANIDGSGVASSEFKPNNVLGFTPRYSEYKIGYDFLTGDFVVPSRRTGMDSYHLFRLFKNADAVLDPAFCLGEQTQYDRVFNNTSDEYDHMYCIHRIFINANRPMKSITETIEFEDGGRELDIPAEGTQLN